jgi:hypothetical protein
MTLYGSGGGLASFLSPEYRVSLPMEKKDEFADPKGRGLVLSSASARLTRARSTFEVVILYRLNCL